MRIIPNMARVSFALFLAALVAGLLASLGTHFHAWDFKVGFQILRWCLYAGIGAFVIGLIWFIASRISGDRDGALFGLIGLVGAVVVLAVPLYNIYIAFTVPPIHDISTDTEHPPMFVAILPLRQGALNPPEWEGVKKLTWQGETKTASEVQKEYYTDIRTFAVLTPPQKLFDRAVEAAKDMGWNIVAVDAKDGRIEATDTTLFFGFTDDIVIRVKPAGMGAKLDIRSKSRVGSSDVGKNASRIRSFMKTLASTG